MLERIVAVAVAWEGSPSCVLLRTRCSAYVMFSWSMCLTNPPGWCPLSVRSGLANAISSSLPVPIPVSC